jgi:phosphoribosylamine--glycine ligase
VKVLVIGGGSREHAIIWKLSQSKQVNQIYCCPGNAGIAELAECIHVIPRDFSTLIDFVKYEWIDLTILGSESVFSRDIVNAFEREGCRILGPNRIATSVNTSRVFAKSLMKKYRIPVPEYKVFTSYLHAQDYVRLKGTPIVIKADGCSGDKGVFVASTVEEATAILRLIMKEGFLGDAGKQVIIEENLRSERLSCICVTDGNSILPLSTLSLYRSTVHNGKISERVRLGSYSPVAEAKSECLPLVMETIVNPALKALNSEGAQYKGVLSADIFVDKERCLLNELSCSFEDLAAETILPRLRNDLAVLITALLEQRLPETPAEWEHDSSACIVLYSGILSEKGGQGIIVNGLEKIRDMKDVVAFHEQTAFNNADVIVSGNKVITINATGRDMHEARSRASAAADLVHFSGMSYGEDIGKRA